MYARVTLLRLGPGRREESRRLSEHLGAALATQPGYRDAVFLADVPGGEWGCVSYWETREQAGEVRTVLGQAMREALAGVNTLEREPNERIMEVLEGIGKGR
jgi:heme-degrading monooxygenase HmoA